MSGCICEQFVLSLLATLSPMVSEVHISTSDAVEVYLRTERRYTKVKRGSVEAPVNEAVFDINSYIEDCGKNPSLRYRPWFRLEVFDKCGKSAQTRAYFVDELIKE